MGSTGVHMHKIMCPNCEYEFYTNLPDPNEYSGKEFTLGCLECEVQITKSYTFTEREDHIDMECDVDIKEGGTDE